MCIVTVTEGYSNHKRVQETQNEEEADRFHTWQYLPLCKQINLDLTLPINLLWLASKHQHTSDSLQDK